MELYKACLLQVKAEGAEESGSDPGPAASWWGQGCLSSLSWKHPVVGWGLLPVPDPGKTFIPCRGYNLLGVARLPQDGVVGLGEGESDFSAPGLETAFAFTLSPEDCVLEPWFKELKCKYLGLRLLSECVHAQLLTCV